jgi:hypothetical protein
MQGCRAAVLNIFLYLYIACFSPQAYTSETLRQELREAGVTKTEHVIQLMLTERQERLYQTFLEVSYNLIVFMGAWRLHHPTFMGLPVCLPAYFLGCIHFATVTGTCMCNAIFLLQVQSALHQQCGCGPPRTVHACTVLLSITGLLLASPHRPWRTPGPSAPCSGTLRS